MQFSMDSRWLAIVSANSARLWDIPDANPTQPTVLDGHGAINKATFSRDRHWLAVQSRLGTIDLCNLKAHFAANHTISERHAMGVSTIVFSPDGRWLAIRAKDEVGHNRLLYRAKEFTK
jgi:WD40 repeat protein